MKKLFFIPLFLLFHISPIVAKPALNLAFVDMNKAINISEAGQRSKKLLEAKARQTEQVLKIKEQEIIKKEKNLSSSLMLSASAKREKREDIEEKKIALRKEIQKNQREFRDDERRHTANIFKDLRDIIKKISKKEKYDLVIEGNLLGAILYYPEEIKDITKIVVKEYDKIQSINK